MTLADIDWPMILAGLGLFLFGIEYMGDGLKNYSGDKLKNIIDKYTSSPFKGILIGAFVTCLIQSSSEIGRASCRERVSWGSGRSRWWAGQ